ncbi:PqiC family protein [Pseudomonas mangiferae]|uniref:Membrane integrity-associated transporter subunit PqiC n=1 Tax=Pseudomonas mangiferae TaxID=2593654 RepID=A0A553GX21_9PSED|nr:ABC-type transport auxiliary lipoprotein family protein [Pseudomonas mangiferae]TRX74023.1 membrane integrity-associated transporter subunit PqiC [Pseudomonas mangiferae]
MNRVRLPILLLLAGVLGLGGCAARAPIPLYQLDNGSPELPKKNQGVAVLLGPVHVADYLQREALLQRRADGSLVAARDGRWAGSLSADIDQVLLRQLASRLDSQRLVLAPTQPGFTPDIQVLLSISRFDSGPELPAVLEAQWRLLDRNGRLRDSRLVRLEQPHQGTPAAQVEAQSVLLRRLAEQLSIAVQPLATAQASAVASPASEPPKSSQSPSRAHTPDKPRIPMASPVRNDVEVFRF